MNKRDEERKLKERQRNESKDNVINEHVKDDLMNNKHQDQPQQQEIGMIDIGELKEKHRKEIERLETLIKQINKEKLLLEYRNTQLTKENAALREQSVLAEIKKKYPEMLEKPKKGAA